MYFLYPVVWVLVILVWACLAKSAKRRRILSGIAVFLFFLFSNDWAITRLYRWWEYPVVPIKNVVEPYEIGVVLGGFTDLSKQPRDRVYLSQGADRLMHAIYLYRLGKVRHILGSGGSGIPNFHDATEAERIGKLLSICQIPAQDVLLELKARNTFENAYFSAQLIKSRYEEPPRILVFTSAFHCRRAQACFEKQGLKVDMFPVDFRFTDPNFNPEKAFIPSDKAWDKWSLLIHEVAGYLMYKIRGYA